MAAFDELLPKLSSISTLPRLRHIRMQQVANATKLSGMHVFSGYSGGSDGSGSTALPVVVVVGVGVLERATIKC